MTQNGFDVSELVSQIKSSAVGKLIEHVEDAVKQASDSSRVFIPKNKVFDMTSLLKCQENPTVRCFLTAIQNIENGLALIKQYGKTTVDTVEDCEFLQPAFHLFVYAHISEYSMFQNEIVESFTSLVDEYLKFKPDDFVTKYLRYIITYMSACTDKATSRSSNYERMKMVIKTGEILANEIKSSKNQSPKVREILVDLYYVVGAMYGVTGQTERALYTYQKCYKLNKGNYRSLYYLAFYNMAIEPEKAKIHFEEFLQMAPKSDKQYPNAYYMLASLYANEKKFDEAFRYSDLAEIAEKERLPFLKPVEVPQKQMMFVLKTIQNHSTGTC